MVTTPLVSAGQLGPMPSDEQIARRVLAGEGALFEVLMRRHNPRVYRAVRAILRDEGEDAMQEAYVRAYTRLSQFDSAAAFSTWLTRIAVSEALRRALLDAVGAAVAETFPFHASRCDRVVAAVLARLGGTPAA